MNVVCSYLIFPLRSPKFNKEGKLTGNSHVIALEYNKQIVKEQNQEEDSRESEGIRCVLTKTFQGEFSFAILYIYFMGLATNIIIVKIKFSFMM